MSQRLGRVPFMRGFETEGNNVNLNKPKENRYEYWLQIKSKIVAILMRATFLSKIKFCLSWDTFKICTVEINYGCLLLGRLQTSFSRKR